MISQSIIFCSILFVLLLWWTQRGRIRYWAALLKERGFKSSVHYDRCLRIVKNLYKNVNAYRLSLDERKAKNLSEDSTLIYGEVTFYNFVHILEAADIKSGEVFYDLGSGSGKAVMIAALALDLGKACGIEKLDSLYELSISLLEKLKQSPEFKQLLPHNKTHIEYIHGDFLEQDISDANAVFINATCFKHELWDELIAKLLTLKVGTKIILSSHELDKIGGFALKYRDFHLMSWGMSRVSIYERI